MFATFKVIFSAIATMFMAVDTMARAGNEVATWAEEEAKGFNEKARLQRNQALKVVRSQYNVEDLKLAHEERTVAANLSAEA